MIELRTLGSVDLGAPEEARDVRPARFQPKRLALLAYLAVERPRGFHSRDTLMSLFWPELDAIRARNSLRQAIFFLRTTLGEDVVTGRGKEGVGLSEGSVWCDAVAFDEAIEGRDLHRAVELYRGDFLAGFHVSDASPEFEWWVDQERVRLRTAALGALRTLADREEAAGRPQAAATLLRRAAQIDPDDERSVRRLVALLGALGDRAGAVQTYEAFRTRTIEEYAVEPSPETDAVIRAVRERETATEGGSLTPAPLAVPVPVPLTPLIGREREIRTALGLLHRSDVRLLTLTGPGGCGKTRLALELASRYVGEEGGPAYFVPFASVRSAGLVLSAIARAVGAPKSRSPLESIQRHLDRREALLVLDNLEHLMDAASDVVELLQVIPGVKILTTSRAPLRVRAERRMEVPSLSLPDPEGPWTPEALQRSEAAALFIDRARAVEDGFRLTDRNASAVAEVCRRLDGLPLAIELAAAATRLYTPETLLERLAAPLDVLADGPLDMPERHRALEATIRTSYDLLAREEQAVFRRMALFVGGAPLEAISAMWEVGGGAREEAVDLVASLVDKSLLRRDEDPDGRTRIGMLETIREFALAALSANGETETWCRWQASYWLSWVEPGEGYYCTLQEPAWLERLEREHDNLRFALSWALAAKEPETALRLGVSLWHFWWQRGYFREGRESLERALAAGRNDTPARLRARALFGAGSLASGMGDQARAIDLMEESLVLTREMDDVQETAILLQNLGYAVRESGDRMRARAMFDEALGLRREMGDARGIATALDSLGNLALQEGGLEDARRAFEESLTLAERTGYRERVAHVLLSLGHLARREGDEDQAAVLYERSLERYRAIRQAMGVGEVLTALADLARRRRADERARELYAEALMIYQETGYMRRVATSVIGLAALAQAQGRPERAARLCAGVDALIESHGVVLEPEDREIFDSTTKSCHRELGESDFAAQWTAGRRMSTEETITLAVQLTPPGPSTARLRNAVGG